MQISYANRIFQFEAVVPEIGAFKQTNKPTLQLYRISVVREIEYGRQYGTKTSYN